jgi:Family of unknown function (DUF6603)
VASDLIASLVGLLADLGHDIATTVGDPEGRAALLARAGVESPGGAPAVGEGPATSLSTLRAKAAGEGTDVLALLAELSEAMIDLVSFVQQVTATHDIDDAWNYMATFLDLIALDRLRTKDPAALALLRTFHLVSNDRLLIADLIRAGDRWGSFVLGHPPDDDAAADSWSLILGAGLAVLGKFVPPEDDTGKAWRVDMLFGWDPDPNAPAPHAERILQRMATLRLTHRDGVGPAMVEEFTDVSMAVVPPGDGGWGMFVGLGAGGTVTFPIGQHLELRIGVDSGSALDIFLGPSSFVTGDGSQLSGTIELRRKQEVAEHWTIGGDKSVHLEIDRFSIGFQFAETSRFHLAVGDGALVLPQQSLGFLASVLPSGGAKLTFDADLQVDQHGKVSFTGGAGMTVTLPVNLSLSVLRVRSITVAFAIEDGAKGAGASLAATAAFGVDFGPAFKVTVDGIGAKLMWALPASPEPPAGGPAGVPVVHGNLGPAGDLSFDFVAPKGIGISIDVGPIKGGGFFYFDPPHRTYAGVLEASLALCGKGIAIKAAGLLRETDDGWDFVLVLSAQFEPAIEIFLGLTLNGVGGMLGINVAVDIDKLRASLHDGSVGRLLFPDDPVGNAPAIIATLVSVFPHRKGGFVAGPMLQLGWGRPTSFVTLSVAVVVALPQPAALLILGRLRIAVPAPELPLVDLKADFLGVIDFDQPSFSFDASLVDSRLAAFAVTGDMTMRAGPGGFIMSVGGFNPRFTPPANVPALRRVAIDISANPITKIRAEAYLAVTSNTFQAGLHAELDIDAGAASVHGWLDFDTLIQWEPTFHFTIHMDIGLELRVGGDSIAGVSVDLLLEGPEPWHAKGDASIHILFFTVHAGFEVTWGDSEQAALPPEVDAAAQVAQALAEPGAWSAIAPDGDACVTFRAVDRDDIGVHPDGRLSIRQQAVPLGIPITRLGRAKVVGGTTTVTVSPVDGSPASAPTMGQFAASQFSDLSDDQKLSRPSFENYQDGISFGAAAVVVAPTEQLTTASYETVFIPDGGRARGPLHDSLLVHAFAVGAIARSGLHFATLNDGPHQQVGVKDPAYTVVAADTMAAAGGTFGSAAAAFAAADATGGRLLVVGAHEVVA